MAGGEPLQHLFGLHATFRHYSTALYVLYVLSLKTCNTVIVDLGMSAAPTILYTIE